MTTTVLGADLASVWEPVVIGTEASEAARLPFDGERSWVVSQSAGDVFARRIGVNGGPPYEEPLFVNGRRLVGAQPVDKIAAYMIGEVVSVSSQHP